jgi:glutathione S-transferase
VSATIVRDPQAANTQRQADEQHSPKFLAVNPRGEVPCLVVGEGDKKKVFSDSSSILVWLAGTHGDGGDGSEGPSSFWSSDLYEQAQIVDWVCI